VMWAIGIRLYKVKLPWRQVAKISFISLLASVTAFMIAARLAPLWAILCGGSASLLVLFGLLYLLRVLEPEDHDRFQLLAGMLPKPVAVPVRRILALMARPESGSAAPAKV